MEASSLRSSWLASPHVKPLFHELNQGQLRFQLSQHAIPKLEPPFHEMEVGGRGRPTSSQLDLPAT